MTTSPTATRAVSPLVPTGSPTSRVTSTVSGAAYGLSTKAEWHLRSMTVDVKDLSSQTKSVACVDAADHK
ncbi:MAG: hypothetical protein P0S95_08225 [Rhabdochlamydiaceae bacterium]|nr:hypothetical protein [Candidatus Amphrikana amoebophyrae]